MSEATVGVRGGVLSEPRSMDEHPYMLVSCIQQTWHLGCARFQGYSLLVVSCTRK